MLGLIQDVNRNSIEVENYYCYPPYYLNLGFMQNDGLRGVMRVNVCVVEILQPDCISTYFKDHCNSAYEDENEENGIGQTVFVVGITEAELTIIPIYTSI